MALKIKSITSFRALHTLGLEDEEIRQHEYLYQLTLFDESGHVLSEETHTPEGILEHMSSYGYDARGYLTEEILTEEDDFVSEHRTLEYNEQGRLLKEQLHYLDGSYDETNYHYDDEGRVLSKDTAGSDGENGNHIKFEFDGKRPVSETEFDSGGEVVAEKKFEYDETGNLILETVVSPDERSELHHEYDEKGKLRVTRNFNSQGKLIGRFTYTRDESDRVVMVKEENVTGVELLNIQYDERGNKVLEETTTEDEELISRIERVYNENDQVLTTQVKIEGRGRHASQDYRIRLEYEQWGE